MGKCFIDFSVIQQDLRRTDKNTVAADAAETVAARFDLGSKWDGLNVYARFQHGPEVYDVPLVDRCATIPHEVLRETGFNVSIFGESADGARLTSARVFVDVEPTISNDGAPPIPATPSLLQRIDALVHASSESARNAAESAQVAQEANAATVEIDGVDTLPAGSAATVTNVGTAQDARLRFGIPKGDKGDKGSGGIPSGGVVGQVVCKTATGEGWTDANAHSHDAGDINAGTLDDQRLPVVPVTKGGTGATTAQQARANIGAADASHTHNAADIAGGTLPIVRGGTGSTDAEGALVSLGAFPAIGGTVAGDVVVLGQVEAESITAGSVYTKDGGYIGVVSNSGTTYAALRFDALKPVYAYRGFAVSQGYGIATDTGVGFTFGDGYITSNKPVTTHCISVSNATVANLGTSGKPLDMSNVLASNTSLLSVGNDESGNTGVVCGVDGYVAVGGCVYVSGANAGDTASAFVKIARANGSNTLAGAHFVTANSSGIASVSIETRFFEVSAGDVIELCGYNSTAARGTCPASARTILSVQYC